MLPKTFILKNMIVHIFGNMVIPNQNSKLNFRSMWKFIKTFIKVLHVFVNNNYLIKTSKHLSKFYKIIIVHKNM